MKSIWIFFLMVLTGSNVFSQDLKADFQAMHALLDGLDSYQLNVSYSAGDSSELKEENTVSAYVSDRGLFYNLGFSTIVINETHTLVVNPSEKTMIYSENEVRKDYKSMDASAVLLESMDTLLTKADSVYFSLSGNTKNYYLRFSNGYFELVHLEFENSILKKATYFYNSRYVEKAGLTAVCNVALSRNPEFDPQLLNSNFYFSNVSGTMKPTEAFSQYLLIYNESIEGITD